MKARVPTYRTLISENLGRALAMAFLVGTILVLINHGDHIEKEPVCRGFFLKVGLSYCVPFAVSLISAVLAARRRT